MKTAAKVFIILGMIFQFYLIFPIIVGAIALKKIKTATKKSDLTVMAILTLFLCNTIGGILMFCIKEEELAPAVAEAVEVPTEE